MNNANLDKAMEIFALLIVGEEVSRAQHVDLYEEYQNNSEVYDILTSVLKKSNLSLYEFGDSLYVTAGEGNLFGSYRVYKICLFDYAEFFAILDECVDCAIEVFAFVTCRKLNTDTSLVFWYYRIVETGHVDTFLLHFSSKVL